MCNCLEILKDKLHAHLMEGVPEGSEIGDKWDGTGWDNEVYAFTGTPAIHVMLKYKLAYKAPKKGGGLAKNFTRKETFLKMSYCPMCGEKQETKADETE